jgi:hypothetical protein
MMSKRKTQSGREYRSDFHDQHLCYLVSQGFHLSDKREFQALIHKPKFQCRHCKQIANHAKNLCMPIEL